MQVKTITGYKKPQYPNKEKLLSKPEVLKQWMPTRWKQSLIIPGILAAALAINPGVLKAASEVNFGGSLDTAGYYPQGVEAINLGASITVTGFTEDAAWSIASTVFGEKGYTLIPTREYYNTLTGEVFTQKEMKDVTGLSPDYLPLSGYCPKLNLGVYLYMEQDKHNKNWDVFWRQDTTKRMEDISYIKKSIAFYTFIPKREKKKNIRDQNMNLICLYATENRSKSLAETKLKNAIMEFLDNLPAEQKQTNKTTKPKQ